MALFNRKPSTAEMQERLSALGITIAKKRDEAVQARRESGIEHIWQQCEEAYLGIDDANRHEFERAKWAKPTNMSGPVTTNGQRNDDTRSTAFVRLTSRYVDFGAAKLAEIVLPIDDKAFSLDPTPVPELVASKDDTSPIPDQAGQPMMRPVGPGETPPMGPDGQPQAQVPMTVKDAVEQIMGQAKEAAKKAERRIYDWMVESRYRAEMTKVIHDAARIGVGVIKGPFPDKSKTQAITRNANVIALKIVEKTVPRMQWVDPENIFPDPACGENIHDGDFLLERDYLSPKRLRDLKKRKGWFADKIEKVLQEGPGKIYSEGKQDDRDKKHRYERWQFYGTLTKEDLEATNVEGLPEECNEAYAIVTLINDTVVRCILNPLDSGKFPYHAIPWSRRAGNWAGVGVAEQVSMPQRMVNAATRAVLENAGISAGVQFVIDQGSITPVNNDWTLTRNKFWLKSPDSAIDDVRKAFWIFEIPNLQAQLMPIIEYGLRLAEEHSSIPLVSMGQYADGASPQTFGQAELQHSNAHTLLRNKGNAIDDHITEPLVQMLYEWLLLDPDVPDEEKGDFKINAHGSIAMVERAIQEMTLAQIVIQSTNPTFGVNPKKAYELFLKTKRIDPRDVQYTEEEQQQIAQQPPPQAPQVEAAKIRAQTELQKEQLRGQVTMQKAAMDVDRDTKFVEEQRERTRATTMAAIEELKLRRELAMMDYASRHQITIDQIRAKLADSTMKLKVQKQLAFANGKGPQVASPPTEPPGRAENGMAYQQ